MAARGWAWVITLSISLLVGAPVFGQQQSSGQNQQPSGSQEKSSTQDLPSAPQPQPTAGQKAPESPRPPAGQRPAPPPSEPGPYGSAGPSTASEPPRAAPPPDGSGSSTSKDDRIDISPPANDAKTHPNAGLDNADVGEFHPFDPHRAAKDVEVGDFYYKQHNYRAAISRYREALLYKPNDAVATFNLADALEKAGDLPEAIQNYQSYLKILPYGPKSKDAHKALQRLHAKAPTPKKAAAKVSGTPAKR